jgi:hypothetical protein
MMTTDKFAFVHKHKQTQAVLLIHDDDFRHYKPTHHDLYRDFRKELQPIFDFIAERYNHDGYLVRALFARLKGHARIDTQTDGLYSLLKCHRIPIPIITNAQVVFTIGTGTGTDKGRSDCYSALPGPHCRP